MDFNSITGSYSSYESASVSAKSYRSEKKSDNGTTTDSSAYSEVSATYEASNSATAAITKGDRSAIIAQMKLDTQNRMEQMQSLVTKMFEKQGITIGTADDMWKILAGGNFTADANTIAQAKADIAKDGYWGVDQTSERIFSFAVALSGGDEEKMKDMVSAVEKGFGQATKAWGKKLPSITDDTHSAIMDKFDKWFEDNGSTATTKDILNS